MHVIPCQSVKAQSQEFSRNIPAMKLIFFFKVLQSLCGFQKYNKDLENIFDYEDNCV